MAFGFGKTFQRKAEPKERSGGWYADPYGTAARRWYDTRDGWTDRVEGAGRKPDETAVAGVDKAT